jgi:Putative GTPase activating protein for Arf
MGVTTAPTSSSAPTGTTSTTTPTAAVVDYSAQRFPMRPEDYKALAKLPGNDHCIDCGSGKEVEWASVSFGILFCAQCSYIHK